jgi:two-component system CheB/CheR fusion protein
MPPSRARPTKNPVPPIEDFLVVAIGASAGGLDACRNFLAALPAGVDMAFILVQHLDPSHESLLVDLLARLTTLRVIQAADQMPVEPGHLYVIPPGTYIAVSDSVLNLSIPRARHGARMPFDFLLPTLAETYRGRAACVVLSGTGADGCLGLQAVRDAGGLTIVQDPNEAGYEGMPQNAIATGLVDQILPVAEIPAALIAHDINRKQAKGARNGPEGAAPWLAPIIDLLRTRTTYDFRLYKPGTLERRIERRLAMAGIEAGQIDRYLDLLASDPLEPERLAKDLLINVTSFFRDPKVFDHLAERVIPELIRTCTADQPLRIWIAGCSTGEETYSLAILFREAITAANLTIKLQVFASDVDPDAVAKAREGVYPETITAEVSAERLARFFTREDLGYRVIPDLRGLVVFTVQDLLTDPPFSRIDLISCRNLLIYLRPEAQTKVVSLFHFSLRDGGILLLGSSETAGSLDGRFAVVSKAERLYRRIGRVRPGDVIYAMGGATVRLPGRIGGLPLPTQQARLAEFCRRLVLETYAPAAVLINRRNEYLYATGPTERYLRVAPGPPNQDLLAMVPEALRTRLRSAIQRANVEGVRIVVGGGHRADGDKGAFSIDVQPVQAEGEALFLVCFVDEPAFDAEPDGPAGPADFGRVAELERELKATRIELHGAIRNLEVSGEEQKAINEEALSVNEEFQSTNEELLTSKEELQSLNEELTALNNQLHETLERQRTTSNDLQNVLYSTDVATIFLDRDLNIRFFTPATKALFNVIPTDIGRPLADLHSLASDAMLLTDARKVLQSEVVAEQEIEAESGAWYSRRVLPYRTRDAGVEGVVITFADISGRKYATEALEAAKRQADLANLAKSRFLAAASHDLRQPLQTLALLQGLLEKSVEGEKPRKLVARFDETLGAMTGILNTMLNINQIEAGTVRAEMVDFTLTELFARLKREFTYHAQAKRLDLRMVPCSVTIHSDPNLIEQILRNLLSNALKYTAQGKVLIGCRRRGTSLEIGVWDSGIGIPNEALETIFEEYHQLDNAARERSRGLGLGLSIVRRLCELLGHELKVRSLLGQGSDFTIAVPIVAPAHGRKGGIVATSTVQRSATPAGRDVEILLIEDDPEVRSLFEIFLTEEGYRVSTAIDGPSALERLAIGMAPPDLILADYNLPNGMNGIQVTAKLRTSLRRAVPVIILTGDISTRTLRDIALVDCVQLNKPVKLNELGAAIDRLLAQSRDGQAGPPVPARPLVGDGAAVIYVVDDDAHIRTGIREVIEEAGCRVEDYPTCETFLEAYRPGAEACLLIDAYLPGMSGLDLIKRLADEGHHLPSIMITGNSDVPMAIAAMKAGASDFIEKPVGRVELLASVERALAQSRDSGKVIALREEAASHVAGLTGRQREIMELVLAGHPSKNIAADLGISQRTVENHRAAIMRKTGAKSLPALARLVVAADGEEPPG